MKIAVIKDWNTASRECFWPELLSRLNDSGLDAEFEEFSIADYVGISDSEGRTLLERLQPCKVIILNWDVINGDPDFGADLSLRWVEHRSLDLKEWVRRGGILIMEGQAALAVGVQKAYDALFGAREFEVSRAESNLDPREQAKRCGASCKASKQAVEQRLFPQDTFAPVAVNRTFDDMFPSTSGKMLSPYMRDVDWNILYRGWIRWTPWRRTGLRWIPLVRTRDRGRKFNHPTMVAAALGSGAYIISSMFLASTNQLQLVRALLDMQGSVSKYLPKEQGRLLKAVRWLYQQIVPLTVAIVLALIGGQASGGITRQAVVPRLTQWAITVGIFGAVLALTWLSKSVLRTWWNVTGR